MNHPSLSLSPSHINTHPDVSLHTSGRCVWSVSQGPGSQRAGGLQRGLRGAVVAAEGCVCVCVCVCVCEDARAAGRGWNEGKLNGEKTKAVKGERGKRISKYTSVRSTLIGRINTRPQEVCSQSVCHQKPNRTLTRKHQQRFSRFHLKRLLGTKTLSLSFFVAVTGSLGQNFQRPMCVRAVDWSRAGRGGAGREGGRKGKGKGGEYFFSFLKGKKGNLKESDG